MRRAEHPRSFAVAANGYCTRNAPSVFAVLLQLTAAEQGMAPGLRAYCVGAVAGALLQAARLSALL